MSPDAPVNSGPHSALFDSIRELDPNTAAERLAEQSDETIGRVLSELPPGRAIEVLGLLPAERHDAIAAAAPFGEGPVWLIGRHYEEGTVGRLMESAPAVFGHDTTIREVIAALRGIINERMVIYVFVTENDGTLVGVVAFRELLFATPEQKLSDVMLRHPFVLRPDMPLVEAMREVVTRHYPIYPVCDAQDRLLGMVRGQVLFEHQAFEISAQAGSMVGVEREERLATPWLRSLRLRHPWLQLNLLTAFVAAAVVGYFQGTLDQIVLLAVFLPVLAGQSGNTDARPWRDAARHDAGRVARRSGAAAGHQGVPARPGERHRGRLRGRHRHVPHRALGERPQCARARRRGDGGDDRELRRQRRRRRAHSADAQAPRRRSRHRIQHLPHHRDRCGEHGLLPRSGDVVSDLAGVVS
jgi:hypothetical protein